MLRQRNQVFGLVAIGAPLVRATMATQQATAMPRRFSRTGGIGLAASLLELAGLDWPGWTVARTAEPDPRR